jgi:drug/metabolite transporter (DMT)-like permease
MPRMSVRDGMSIEAAARPGRGVFWMVVTGLLFVGVTALVKVLGTRVPAPQAAFLRYVLGLVFLLPMLATLRDLRLDRRTWGLIGARGAFHTAGVALWFFAMARIPLADVTAMNYLSPVYVTLGAALFLGERLAVRRVMAVVVALIGALIILRPGFRDVGPGHVAMIFTAIFFGGSYLLAKMISARLSAGVVVAMLSITVTVGLAPMAWAVWVPPTSWELAVLFGVACLATGGHYTMTLAFRAAPLAVTQPVTFLQLVWAVILGAVMFGEGVDPFVVLGGTVIVGAVSFIAWREAVLKRRVTPPVPAMKM